METYVYLEIKHCAFDDQCLFEQIKMEIKDILKINEI